MIVGFTGTREGMTPRQLNALVEFLTMNAVRYARKMGKPITILEP